MQRFVVCFLLGMGVLPSLLQGNPRDVGGTATFAAGTATEGSAHLSHQLQNKLRWRKFGAGGSVYLPSCTLRYCLFVPRIRKRELKTNKKKDIIFCNLQATNILARNAFKPSFAPDVALGWQELLTTPDLTDSSPKSIMIFIYFFLKDDTFLKDIVYLNGNLWARCRKYLIKFYSLQCTRAKIRLS